MHSGHLKYFNQAKKFGNKLIVSVTADKFVNKGPLRPINKIKDRIEVLNNIKSIDKVIESNYPTAEYVISKIKPDFYCKGPDYLKKILKIKIYLKKLSKSKNMEVNLLQLDT